MNRLRTRAFFESPLWTEAPAFSLTEVVIALGVAAVAFTTIIGLFPLGLNMSRESYEETQAALIAQTLMADLRDQQTGNGNKRTKSSPYTTRLIQTNFNSDPIGVISNHTTIALNTTNQNKYFLAYNQPTNPTNDTDTNGSLIFRPCAFINSTSPPAWYTKGSNGLFAVIQLTVSPSCRFGGPSGTGFPMRVDMSIETPGTASVTNRTCFQFTGLTRY